MAVEDARPEVDRSPRRGERRWFPSLMVLVVIGLPLLMPEHLRSVETLVRQPSGAIVAYHAVGEDQRASIVDPATGAAVAAYRPSAVQRWVKNLHRKLMLDDAGRVAVGVAAACMLFIVVVGVLLLARRMGGWKRLFGPVRGNPLQRLHNETARVVSSSIAADRQPGRGVLGARNQV